MSDFVHLHVHSEYSLLDGAIRLNQSVLSDTEADKVLHVSPLTEALKAMGMNACAITDHGNLYGVHTFVSAMRAAGLKPIIGSEFYVHPAGEKSHGVQKSDEAVHDFFRGRILYEAED